MPIEPLGERQIVGRRDQPLAGGVQPAPGGPRDRGGEHAEGERAAGDPVAQVGAPDRGQPLAGEIDQRPAQRQHRHHGRGAQRHADLEHPVDRRGPGEGGRHEQREEDRPALAGQGGVVEKAVERGAGAEVGAREQGERRGEPGREPEPGDPLEPRQRRNCRDPGRPRHERQGEGGQEQAGGDAVGDARHCAR